MSTEPIYSMTAPEIAGHLDVTPRTVRMWVESRDLPRLDRGQFDIGWASWLATGRKVSAQWPTRPSAHVLVAAAWLQAQDRTPTDEDLQALGGLFERNGYTLAQAMKAVGAAQAHMGRA